MDTDRSVCYKDCTKLCKNYNELMKKYEYEIWEKDGIYILRDELYKNNSINEIPKRSVDFFIKFLKAEYAIIYLYNEKSEKLRLAKVLPDNRIIDFVKIEYELGQGSIGKVALEREPIILKRNLNGDGINYSLLYSSLCILEEVNSYIYPLVYEDELFGVIEIGLLKDIDEYIKDFIEKTGLVISTNLYSSIQNERIMDLLKVSETARNETKKMANELKLANEMLVDQKHTLLKQTEELQLGNAQLKEQKILLEQQSQELKVSNMRLEKQQRILEHQATLLNDKNIALQRSGEELKKRSKQVELSNKQISNFLANVSHELRTPLNSIILLSRLLLNNNQDLDDGTLEKIDVIYKCGLELLRLINDILDITKIDAGKMQINLVSFNTKELSNELLYMFEGVTKEKNLAFVIEDSFNEVLCGDKDKISQILRNFLSNAFKFTEKGEVRLKIIKGDGDDSVIFSVLDTGIGIPGNKQEVVFEEFQQGDGSICRKYGGTGLGLPISKGLAKLIGGYIRLESIEGRGSNFSLTVYNGISEQTKQSSLDNIEGFNKCKVNSRKFVYKDELEGSILKGKRILVVDDDPRNVFTLAAVLENYGATVLEAEDGIDALGKMANTDVDLILMDIMMPRMNGYDTIIEIKKIERFSKIPIVVVTAKNIKSNVINNKVGADDFISKPLDYEMLMKIIKKNLKL